MVYKLINLFVGLYFIVANYYKGTIIWLFDVFTIMCINVEISAIPVLSCSIYEINFRILVELLSYLNILTINDCYKVYDNTYY